VGFNSGFPDGFTKTAGAAEHIHAGIGVGFRRGVATTSVQAAHRLGPRTSVRNRQKTATRSPARATTTASSRSASNGRALRREPVQDRWHRHADRVFPGSAFDSDFDAAIHLIQTTAQKPGIFMN